ncbi:LANO_0G18140g1_1 [Lachancea nothofagi CBS 11611]|uniref:LANO_0G18140g1_1 n=1 Tax=Lachancea nothofagi CBS 11611 TaxID=1266666 RepID=A0A1G4KKM2_9SACH|nr:LANO_0G18140g1_1 [Lachancea nothofagi CBS 11611]
MESLDRLKERLWVVENRIGDAEYSESLLTKVDTLSRELRHLYRDGVECSKTFWRLLDVFIETNGVEASANEQTTLETCLGSLDEIMQQLGHLEMWYREEDLDHVLSCGVVRVPSGAAQAQISKLPLLFAQVSELIVGTMMLLQRFMNLNVEDNKFWNCTEQKVRFLERKLKALEESKVI